LGDRTHVTRAFLLGLTAYSLVGLTLFFLHGREGAHVLINQWHHPWGDLFFRYITDTAHGAVPVLAIHLLLFVRYSWALALGVSASTMGIVVQWLKRGVFDLPRPSAVFDQSFLHWVEGVDYASRFSFPSGHAGTAFAMFFMFALMANRRWATWAFLIWALMASFSRVYISQHFIEDTVVGAWIGIATTWLAWRFIIVPIEKKPANKLNGRFWPS
jgi:membrane-associated phospholipid phosphatase